MNPTPACDVHDRALRIARDRGVSLFEARRIATVDAQSTLTFTAQLEDAVSMLGTMPPAVRSVALAVLTKTAREALKAHGPAEVERPTPAPVAPVLVVPKRHNDAALERAQALMKGNPALTLEQALRQGSRELAAVRA